MPRPPSWRELERAFLEVLADYGIAFTEERGERYIRHKGVEYNIGDLAKEMEKRL